MIESKEKWQQGALDLEGAPHVPDEKNLTFVPEKPEVPEGTTHVIPTGKDVFFQSDPKNLTLESYENAYKTLKPFYAKFTKKNGSWSYFESTQEIIVYRDGNLTIDKGALFRVESKYTIKI